MALGQRFNGKQVHFYPFMDGLIVRAFGGVGKENSTGTDIMSGKMEDDR